MKLSEAQEEYIRCLDYVRKFRNENPEAAALARYKAGLRRNSELRKGPEWREYHREYTRKHRAARREEEKRMEVPMVFSEITLSDGDRSILIHVRADGSWNVPSYQPRWGSKPPNRQTAKRWIRNGYHGDISEEPEFVQSTFAAIKTK